MLAQTILGKLVDTVAYLFLGMLLLKEDFGLVSIAVAVRVFTDVLQRMGLQQILVQRHAKFDRWSTPAFWMALCVGGVGTLFMVIAAPMVAAIFHQPELLHLVLTLAFVPTLGAMGTVPMARLQSNLRFRALASTQLVFMLSISGLRVVFAFLGLGALGFVLPVPIAEAGKTIALWWFAKPRIRLSLRLRRWKYLLADSAWLFGGTNAVKLVEQVDYLILALFHPPIVVGAYFFTYSLSIQSIRLFSFNLENVLLPALSHLQTEPTRQIRAYLKAARLLALIGIPICFMQAAVVDPAIRTIYSNGKWDDAIPIAQVLSIGMSMWVIYGPTASLIKSQGRFKLFAIMSWIYAICFAGAVTIAAWIGEAVSVAVAVGICMTIYGPIQVYIGIHQGEGTWADVGRIYIPPLIMGMVSTTIGLTTASLLPEMPYIHIVRAVITLGLGGMLYLGMLFLLMPRVWHELLDHLNQLKPSQRVRPEN